MQKGVQQGRFGSLWFFWLLDPFLVLQRPKSIKNGSGSLYFGFPWSDVSFSSCWTPFCVVSGLDPPKRGPPQPDFRLATFSCCLDPFFVPSATYPPKRVLWPGVKFASAATFSLALPHGDAVPVLALSVPSSACGRCSLCGCCCLDILPFLFRDLQSMPFIQGSPSSVGRAQGPWPEDRGLEPALGLKCFPP